MIDNKAIKAELTPERFIRETNNAGNHIYEITCNNAPNVLREIGDRKSTRLNSSH